MKHRLRMILIFGPLKAEVEVEVFPANHKVCIEAPAQGEEIAFAPKENATLSVWNLIFERCRQGYDVRTDTEIIRYREYRLIKIC